MLESLPFKNYPILFVDDEAMAIITFKHLFQDDFTIYTAQNGKEALQVLEAHPEIAIVATDQRMPVMSGLDLLMIIAQKYPEKINILITAYSDLALVVEAINKGNLFRYISKPYEEEFLKQTLMQAINRYHLLAIREDVFKAHQDPQDHKDTVQ
jgi:DNA-binding NtrC family response regulator